MADKKKVNIIDFQPKLGNRDELMQTSHIWSCFDSFVKRERIKTGAKESFFASVLHENVLIINRGFRWQQIRHQNPPSTRYIL